MGLLNPHIVLAQAELGACLTLLERADLHDPLGTIWFKRDGQVWYCWDPRDGSISSHSTKSLAGALHNSGKTVIWWVS